MYEATSDRYCYPGTNILRNKADIRDAAALEATMVMSFGGSDEPLADEVRKLVRQHRRAT